MAKKPTHSSKNSTTQQPEWADKIPDVAQQIVEVFSDAAPKGKQLDLSADSIKVLDSIIKKLWGEEGPSEENREMMIWGMGCYIAEVLQRNYRGVWRDGGDGYVFECENASAGVAPWNWVAKRFDLGMSESLASKYKFAQSILSADRKMD